MIMKHTMIGRSSDCLFTLYLLNDYEKIRIRNIRRQIFPNFSYQQLEVWKLIETSINWI